MVNTSYKMLMYLSAMLLMSTMYLMLNHYELIIEWEIISMFSSMIKLELIMEWTSMLYSSIVVFISANVLMFSKEYMSDDLNKSRFTAIVLLFIMSMNLLIFIPHMMCLLIGWDGLGITSFILVMYYNNSRSMSASMLTMLTNRFGDAFILLAIIMTLDSNNWSMVYNYMENQSTMLSLSILMAAMTKSAQMPFSSWLPAAMAAPTPVSALVHSSTLVTAGVFLLYRFNYMMMQSKTTQMIMLMTSLSTMIMASTSAFHETDMKKVIALSTLSQLGFMMLALSLKMPMLAFFHMSMHAMFKALLFIATGCLIMMNNHVQDMRLYGQFFNSSPMITSSIIISSSAMVGVPFLSGFYSKHMIMEISNMLYMNMFIYIMVLSSIFMTAYYSTRLILFSLMTTKMSMPASNYIKLIDSHTSLIIMSTSSIFLGSTFSWLSLMIPTTPETSNNLQSNLMITMILMALTLSTFIISTSISLMSKIFSKSYKFTLSLSFMNMIFTQFPLMTTMNLSLWLYKHLDQSWLEKFTSLSLPMNIYKTSFSMENNLLGTPQKMMFNSITGTMFFLVLISIMN